MYVTFLERKLQNPFIPLQSYIFLDKNYKQVYNNNAWHVEPWTVNYVSRSADRLSLWAICNMYHSWSIDVVLFMVFKFVSRGYYDATKTVLKVLRIFKLYSHLSLMVIQNSHLKCKHLQKYCKNWVERLINCSKLLLFCPPPVSIQSHTNTHPLNAPKSRATRVSGKWMIPSTNRQTIWQCSEPFLANVSLFPSYVLVL